MKFGNTIKTMKRAIRVDRLASATMRKAAIGLTAAGLAVSVSTQFGAIPAHANTSSAIGTIGTIAACYYSTHTMTMDASIDLSNAVPVGAWIISRYAYARVDSSGRLISGFNYTDWKFSQAPSATVYWSAFGPYTSRQLSLPGETWNNVWDYWKVWATAGVWNGSSYDWSGWNEATYEMEGSQAFAPYCRASLTNG